MDVVGKVNIAKQNHEMKLKLFSILEISIISCMRLQRTTKRMKNVPLHYGEKMLLMFAY